MRYLWLFLWCCNYCFAQTKFNLAQVKAKFPDDEMAFLTQIERVTIEIENNKPVIRVFHQKERLFLTDRASNFADERLYYSETFQEITDLEAFTWIPDKTGFKKNIIDDVRTERPSPGGGIFYDDMLVKKLAYSSAKKGGVGVITYRERVKDPFMLSGFTFGNFMPILNAEFSVSFPANVKVSYKTYNDQKGITFSKTTQNGQTTYRWLAQNIKANPIEAESQSLRYYVPYVQLFIESYTANGQTTEVLGDVPKLFKHNSNLVRTLNQNIDKQLKTLTDSLTQGKTEIDKTKAIYYWVQDHIKYIAFEEGMGGFVPRQANEVCSKRYGDCKDMASLLTAMLKIAQIPAYLVWIGTREIPFKYAENPSMGVDNHMIAAIKQNGAWVFLDATDDRIDYGLPTWHIQGKEAMVMTSNDTYEIVKVPIVPAATNSRRDSTALTWEGRTLSGTGFLTLDGFIKTHTQAILQVKSGSERDEYYQNSFFVRGSNKCTLIKNSNSGLNEREKPLRFVYEFKVPDYIQTVDNEVFINPHLKRTWADKNIATRRTDWEHDYQWNEENIVTIPIPKNYEVTYIPNNATFVNPNFSFTITYQKQQDQILVHTKLIQNTLLVKKETFPAWNNLITALNDAYGEVISMKKSKSP
jgi:Domain of Unknown Function with PDB structure (DUF3857)/Transglutaminase-like superfamily